MAIPNDLLYNCMINQKYLKVGSSFCRVVDISKECFWYQRFDLFILKMPKQFRSEKIMFNDFEQMLGSEFIKLVDEKTNDKLEIIYLTALANSKKC
jgi:hypothetical protein